MENKNTYSFIRKIEWNTNTYFAGKTVASILYASLHLGEVLTHDDILRNTNELLILNLYCSECELAPVMLCIGCGRGSRFLYFNYIVSII